MQEIIDRLSRSPTVYGVVVYETDGGITYSSDPVRAPTSVGGEVLDSVLRSGAPVSVEREVDGIAVFSVIHPIADADGAVVGAFEVAQPLATVQAQVADVRQRFILNTLTLLGALTVVILWLVRRYLAEPLQRFVDAVRALERGELTHRIDATAHSGELDTLAREFNRMAEHLEGARAELMLEAERREALARRVRETEKMAAIGNVAAGVAHEIAAPLNVIRGRAELLLRRELPEADTRNARIITGQIERITRIVRDLLDYARRREPRPRPLEAGRLVDGVLEFVEPELRRTAVEVHRTGPEELWVHADPELMERVLLNLVMNAVQALETVPEPRRLTVALRVLEDGSSLGALEVRDSGPGVAAEDRERVFGPYFTTKAGTGGTGLGLALARSIVVEHGGRMEVAEAVEGGALFRILLPTARALEVHHA